jgi:hypothetical protein
MIRQLLLTLILVSTAATTGRAADNWSFEAGRDPDNWHKVSILSVESINEIADEYATKMLRPQLSFRCEPGADGATSVRVDWRRFISSFNTEVSFKADDKDLLLLNWGVDKTNKITMPRAARDGQDLLDYLEGASRLQIEVIPYAGSLIAVTFDISGIDDALRTLASECS